MVQELFSPLPTRSEFPAAMPAHMHEALPVTLRRASMGSGNSPIADEIDTDLFGSPDPLDWSEGQTSHAKSVSPTDQFSAASVQMAIKSMALSSSSQSTKV
jgi:hypothetical protein